MGKRKSRGACNAAEAGAAQPPPCSPRGGPACAAPADAISERLANLAERQPERCSACGERQGNGPGWGGLCSPCFATAPWEELLRQAPLPDRHLRTALSAPDVERRLKDAAAHAAPRRELSDEELRAQYLAMGIDLSEEQLIEVREQCHTADSADVLAERTAAARVAGIDVADDGNCQFRAVARALFGSERLHSALRAAAHAWLCENRGKLGYGLEEEYLEQLRCGAWGDCRTLQALARVTGARLVVASAEPGNWVDTMEGGAGDDRVACVLLNAVHYNTAIAVEHRALAAACAAADRLEEALAEVRAAADAPGGQDLAVRERTAAEEAAKVFREYPGIDRDLWARALGAATQPLRAAPGTGPRDGQPSGLPAHSSPPRPRQLEECSAEEGAARVAIAAEREALLLGLRIAADEAARSAAQLGAAERRVTAAERRAEGQAAAHRAALEQAEERAAVAERAAAVERAARVAAEIDLAEARTALHLAQQRELLQQAEASSKGICALEAAGWANISTAAELQAAKGALQAAQYAALGASAERMRLFVIEGEAEERRLAMFFFERQRTAAAEETLVPDPGTAGPLLPPPARAHHLAAGAAARAGRGGQQAFRGRAPPSRAAEQFRRQLELRTEDSSTCALPTCRRLLSVTERGGPRCGTLEQDGLGDRETALRLRESLARAALRHAADRELLHAVAAMQMQAVQRGRLAPVSAAQVAARSAAWPQLYATAARTHDEAPCPVDGREAGPRSPRGAAVAAVQGGPHPQGTAVGTTNQQTLTRVAREQAAARLRVLAVERTAWKEQLGAFRRRNAALEQAARTRQRALQRKVEELLAAPGVLPPPAPKNSRHRARLLLQRRGAALLASCPPAALLRTPSAGSARRRGC
eukprot:TRINITY_DN22853_c0_g2_i6.p1 TRINITY_DN22853_c0_g2~~TRINITY_DN22853_c0_g2_i6.p1  ORF type:complete len:881 (+),score=213.80 TRINITY_DN22853_c0_g2_i6:75-2717(+)